MPSAPPRGVDAVVLNATSARVSWKPPVAERQHGKIRGYQVTYARRTAGERTVSPRIRELLLRDPQVWDFTSLTHTHTHTSMHFSVRMCCNPYLETECLFLLNCSHFDKQNYLISNIKDSQYSLYWHQYVTCAGKMWRNAHGLILSCRQKKWKIWGFHKN